MTAAAPTITNWQDLRICSVWQQHNPKLNQALVQFWLHYKAISNQAEAMRRTADVVCIVLDNSDTIAGVSSVYLAAFGEQNQPYWFYRSFIRPNARRLGLQDHIFAATFLRLAQTSAQQVQGVAVVTENTRLMSAAARRRMAKTGLQYIGLNPQQQDIWVKHFA